MNQTLKKFFTLLLVAISSSLLAGIYGILHDETTYVISWEYYTKFKFIQFGINDFHLQNFFKVAIVGFLATWWFGLFLGFFLGISGIHFKDWRTMYRNCLRTCFIAILITFCFEIIGFLYGYFVISNKPKSELSYLFIPENIINFKRFISVGVMHTFGYFGALVGLIYGMIVNYRKSKLSLE